MKPLSIEKLAHCLNAEIPGSDTASAESDRMITGVSTDSRTIKPGDCFFAIKGENFDGHHHIGEAFDKGAVCAVTGNMPKGISGPVMKVKDAVEALGDLARWYRTELRARLIAITGSAGKTTTRNLVHHAASRHFACHQSPKSFNNHIGLPLTILSTEPEHEILVTELGSNNPGEIAYLTDIARPDIAAVTNVHPAHLEGFGHIDNIVREKASISLGLGPDGHLLINGDFQNLLNHCDTLRRKYTTFGTSQACDIRATELATIGTGGRITIEGRRISVPLPGRANLENVLAAWALCRQLGISIDDFAKAIETFQPVDMRMQIQKIGALTVINDCYNANPASMANAIDCLAALAADRGSRAVFVCGPMAELGDHSDRWHLRLGHNIADTSIDVLLTAGPAGRITADAAKERANPDFQAHVFADNRQLCRNLVDFVREDDIILVKGSRSAALEEAVEKLKELFSR